MTSLALDTDTHMGREGWGLGANYESPGNPQRNIGSHNFDNILKGLRYKKA
jgi:hypothetical protein